jgi:hypothetical protein
MIYLASPYSHPNPAICEQRRGLTNGKAPVNSVPNSQGHPLCS